MVLSERITFFGDIKNVNVTDIRNFVEATGHLYGGSYPSREDELSDEEVVKRTRELLSEAGILNHHPITLCSSIEERATKILQDCNLRRVQNGIGLYWIVDSNPHSLLEAVKSVTNNDNIQADILRSITVVALGLQHTFDYVDPVTGIRVTALPTTYHFPVHPTPAF